MKPTKKINKELLKSDLRKIMDQFDDMVLHYKRLQSMIKRSTGADVTYVTVDKGKLSDLWLEIEDEVGNEEWCFIKGRTEFKSKLQNLLKSRQLKK